MIDYYDPTRDRFPTKLPAEIPGEMSVWCQDESPESRQSITVIATLSRHPLRISVRVPWRIRLADWLDDMTDKLVIMLAVLAFVVLWSLRRK